MHGFYHAACAACVILILSALVPAAVFADGEKSLHSSIPKARFQMIVKEDASTSTAGGFLRLGIRGVYQPKSWGAGLELSIPWNEDRGDSYALLDAMVLYGWLSMGAGASMMMTAPRPASTYEVPPAIMPYGTFGMMIPGFRVGPGRLGLNFSFDILCTAFPKSLLANAFSETLTSPGPSLGSQVFGPGLAALGAGFMTVFKLTVGFNYSFDL